DRVVDRVYPAVDRVVDPAAGCAGSDRPG
ncbi:MAG: hypothetical protein JWP82_2264, partial [Humibacillus sp.]|nr:hypothetical protein [Humibacillus sp.]